MGKGRGMIAEKDGFARIDWDGAVPVSTGFDDPYFSRADGVAETDHVFLAGNGLPGRFGERDVFEIAELGFGTGLNAFLTALRHRDHAGAGRLRFTSFEMFPMRVMDMRQALAPYPALLEVMDDLQITEMHEGENRFECNGIELFVVVGDANRTLYEWGGMADAWFLDGFSPAKNPELWGAELMAAVHAHTRAGGTFATYTAAGWVRRNLRAAGFSVEKAKGFGSKRDMLRGWR